MKAPALTLLAMLTVLGQAALPQPAPAPPAAPLRAGAAAVRITPALTRPVFLAGYDGNRLAESVHDDLWARALVLDDGATRVAVVALDLVGLFNARVRHARTRVMSVPGEQVLIACTHVHSGPDTLGLWGPSTGQSGVDPLYMERLETKIASVVEVAARGVRPVRLLSGAARVPDGLVHNSREPIQDYELTSLRFVDGAGSTVATVLHYGGHPEVNTGRAITSDFVHHVRQAVEARHGGVALYLNGALGGMVTPKVAGNTLEEMRRVGEGVGRAALLAISREEQAPVERLALRRKDVFLPLENERFKLMLGLKVFDPPMAEAHRDGRLLTEVWRVDLGRRVTWITIPGEILPRPAIDLKAMMPGRGRMVVALGNDELGYILDPVDWPKELYQYERSMSVGPRTWPLLFGAAKELLR